MPLSDGDPAESGDIWFRVATQENHLVRGRVHHSAFKGKALAPPDQALNRPWALELSGRLRSIAGSVNQVVGDAVAYCAKQSVPGQGTKVFNGVMYVRVERAGRAFENSIDTAVYYTPLTDDTAHADFVFLRAPSVAEHSRLIDWLQDLFEVLHAPQMHFLPEAKTSGAVDDDN
jgi:hypothetical protein